MKKISNEEALTQKQRLFIEHYVQSGNATKAALTAGYSKKSAYQQAHENLRKPDIQKEIKIAQDQILSEARIKCLSLIDIAFEALKNVSLCSTSEKIKLSAATYILDHAFKLADVKLKTDLKPEQTEVSKWLSTPLPTDPVAASLAYQEMIKNARLFTS